MALNPPIEAALTRLRPWRLDDLDAYHRIWGDPEVIFWGADPDRATSARRLEELLAADAGLAPGLGWRAVLEKATGEIVGDVVLRPAQFYPGEIEIGYHLARAAWGRGLASDAVQALVEHARTSLRLARLVAAILPTNERSIRVAERAGFRRWGTTLHAGLVHGLWALPLAGGAR